MDDSLIKISPFQDSGSIFQKGNEISYSDANLERCITIIGLVGEELSLRKFDVEFPSIKEKEEFVEKFKICVSHEFKKNKVSY